jgi:hypothetical protein
MGNRRMTMDSIDEPDPRGLPTAGLVDRALKVGGSAADGTEVDPAVGRRPETGG